LGFWLEIQQSKTMNEAADDGYMLTVLISSLSSTTRGRKALNPPHTASSSHACLRPYKALLFFPLGFLENMTAKNREQV
jgi:hypothetical protein